MAKKEAIIKYLNKWTLWAHIKYHSENLADHIFVFLNVEKWQFHMKLHVQALRGVLDQILMYFLS